MPIDKPKVDDLFTKLSFKYVDRMVAEVNKVQIDIESFVESQSDLSDEQLSDVLKTGEGVQSIIDQFRTGIIVGIDGTINFSETLGELIGRGEEGGEREKLRWTNHGKANCPDCLAREGEVRSRGEWVYAGLPKSGWSLCGSNCDCTLEKDE
jgi:hypothetical protein